MSQPRVTVLMSCYNAEKWLRDAIESVLFQTFTDFEFVIVNDGSRDSTLKIIRSYASKDSRIVVVNKKNTGLADSLNRGIHIARGQWIARLDADDLCEPGRLEKQFNYVLENPAINLLGTGSREIDAAGLPIKIHHYPKTHERLVKRLERHGAFFPHSSAFYSAKLARSIGGYRSCITRAEDKDFFLRLSERGELTCLPDQLVRIRKHQSQISNDDGGRRQLIDSWAASISYFLRRYGVTDPTSVGEKNNLDQYFNWIEKRLNMIGAFERRKFWKDARTAYLAQPNLLLGILQFGARVSRSGFIYQLLAERLTGSSLPRKLAVEWAKRSNPYFLPPKNGTHKITIKPNFFIVGAPKSGTTSLSEYLKENSHIYFSPVKEPHYFDFDASVKIRTNFETYLSLFYKADPKIHKAIGEGSTGYLFSKCAIPEILKFNPDAKFIVMLRNPVDLVQAWHGEMFYEGLENISDFEKAWLAQEQRKKGENIPASCWDVSKLMYSEWGMLGDQVEKLFSFVKKNKIKIIIFDDFVSDTKKVYEEVLKFLEVPTDNRKDFPIINERKKLILPWLQPELAFLANVVRGVRAKLGIKIGYGWGFLPKIFSLNTEPGIRRIVGEDFKSELNSFYLKNVVKLSKLLKRDLTYWVATRR